MTAPPQLPTQPTEALTRAVSTFLAAWTTRDPAQRLNQLSATCTGDVLYRDPAVRTEGIDALADHISTFTAQFAGHRIVLTSDVDTHHDVARFGWTAYHPTGQPALTGTNTVELTDTGLLHRVIAFFGPLPPRTYTFNASNASRAGPGNQQ
ncbi:nuclear transport factor 2 family protein [Frankia sp. Cas3]|uniref:nuclear transport factor 2 family protein n=1 Tax=Frankia sp. Cas3 TaxID=3073926 RepID=UPI002AD4A636|nr:nuclear transport factor 2 family protein [Frankia sp. Cas3]